MESLSKFIAFVNEQSDFHEKMAEKFTKSDARRAEKHTSTATTFKELALELAAFPEKLAAAQQSKTKSDATKKPIKSLYLGLDEVEGLPDELIKELGLSDGDRTDYSILRIVDDCGGIASLDRIMFCLYQNTKEIIKRPLLTSRLYRMSQRGQIFSVPDRKGVYSTRELTPQEADELLGQ